MKAYLILLLLTLGFTMNAQISFKFGMIKSTVNSSNLKDLFKYESNVTPLFGGVYYNISPLNLFGLETGLQYQGYSGKWAGSSETQKSHYLSVPLAINYKPSALISPGIGLQISHLLSSSLNQIVIDNKFDLSAFAKVNINFLQSFGGEIGYNLGLIPFSTITFTDDNGNNIGESNFSNRYIYLALKYKI
jgi:hypothetical protein